MKASISALIVLLSVSLAHSAEGEMKAGNGATVPAPAVGFTWQKVQESEATDKAPKVEFHLASKEGSEAKVILIVEHAAADTDAKKIARLKADYNSMAKTVMDQGYTELKGSKPPLTPPIPQRAGFTLQGKDKAGAAHGFEMVLVFGKAVYHFQVSAATPEEAKSLAAVAEKVKE
jgi:hypothetical protein